MRMWWMLSLVVVGCVFSAFSQQDKTDFVLQLAVAAEFGILTAIVWWCEKPVRAYAPAKKE